MPETLRANWPITAGHDSDNTPESRPLERLGARPATAGRPCAGPLIGATDSSRLALTLTPCGPLFLPT